MPLASVATEPPSAVMARCCGTGPTISALSAPRIQAGRVNGSECTFSKPPAFSLASAHATALLWASVPARRCPISVDSVAKLWLRLRLDRDSVDQHCDSQGAVDDGAARARTGSILLQV